MSAIGKCGVIVYGIKISLLLTSLRRKKRFRKMRNKDHNKIIMLSGISKGTLKVH